MMGVLSLLLTVFYLIKKQCSVYGALCFGFSFFIGLFLLELAVFIRCFGTSPTTAGFRFTFHQLLSSNEQGKVELLANILALIPFGLFLSEFLASAKRFSARRRLRLATLAGFGLSIGIECLQLLLGVGIFELTDLVMNTLGAFVGAGAALLFRRFLHALPRSNNDK